MSLCFLHLISFESLSFARSSEKKCGFRLINCDLNILVLPGIKYAVLYSTSPSGLRIIYVDQAGHQIWAA